MYDSFALNDNPYNFLNSFPLTAQLIKGAIGFSPERSIPTLHFQTLENWFDKYRLKINQDEFTFEKVLLILILSLIALKTV